MNNNNNKNNLIIESNLIQIEKELNELNLKINLQNSNSLNLIDLILNKLELINNNLLISTNSTNSTSTNNNNEDNNNNNNNNNEIIIIKELNNEINLKNQEIINLNFKESNQSLNKLIKSIEKKLPSSNQPLTSLFPPKLSSSSSSSSTNNNNKTTTPTTNFTPTSLYSYSSSSSSLLPIITSTSSSTTTSTTTTTSSSKIPTTTATVEIHKPFSSKSAIKALHQTISLHLARLNLIEPLETFLIESTIPTIPIGGTITTEDDDDDGAIGIKFPREEIEPSPQKLKELNFLHLILNELKNGICINALEWLNSVKYSTTTSSSSSSSSSSNKKLEEEKIEIDKFKNLEFLLRKEEFIRILLSPNNNTSTTTSTTTTTSTSTSDPTTTTTTSTNKSSVEKALEYGSIHFRSLLSTSSSTSTSINPNAKDSTTSGLGEDRDNLINSLFTSVLYLPIDRLINHSPYKFIFKPYSNSTNDIINTDDDTDININSDSDTNYSKSEEKKKNSELIKLFTYEYLNYINLNSYAYAYEDLSPLNILNSIGSTVALSKILKVFKVIKDKRTEWSLIDELPVEIPLPIKYKFHSIFICPVSKEQSTEENFPVLLNCGHVIVRESLIRLAKGTQTVKCPYCPAASRVSSAIRLHF